jgi:hypothetical protein
MDQFRFPALFRVFIILSFAVVAGYGFNEWVKGSLISTRRLGRIIMGLATVIFGFGVFQLFRGKLDMLEFIKHDAFIFSDKSSISQHIFLQAIIQLSFLALLFLLIKSKAQIKILPILVLALLFTDLAVATRLNGPYTLYSHLYRSKDIYLHSKKFPEGFPLPGEEKIIHNKDQGKLVYKTFWRNLNIFHKQVSYQGYNPMQLKGYVDLTDNHPWLFETILNNPLAYLSDQALPLDSLDVMEKAKDISSSAVFLNNRDYTTVSAQKLEKVPGDTLHITAFSPNELRLTSQNKEAVLVNVLQMNYHGWNAEVDGKQARIMTGNLGPMSLAVPAGQHEVVFSYRPGDVVTAFYISLLALTGGLVILVLSSLRRKV